MPCRILILLLLCVFGKTAGQNPANNYAKMRAVFLYNFTRYFEWPEKKDLKEFKIGLLGADSAFVSELNLLASKKTVKTLPIVYATINRVEELSKESDMLLLYVDAEKFPEFRYNKKNRNTLVVTYNNRNLFNTHVAFMDVDGKLKFAFNTYLSKQAGLIHNPEFERLASVVVRNSSDSKIDRAANAEWASVVDKIRASLSSNKSEVLLSKKELQEVSDRFRDQENRLDQKTSELRDLGTDLEKKQKTIDSQFSEINAQKDSIQAQNRRIGIQLQSIMSQEERIKLQENRLKLTIEENRLQQEVIALKRLELQQQQRRIQVQKDTLRSQHQAIRKQSKVLMKQMEQINMQKTILWLSLATVCTFIAGISLLYFSFKRTKRLNTELSRQKNEISLQKNIIEEKQSEIVDSINYAQRIQRSMLASDNLLKLHLKDYFILFLPKDIVSGDFYWASALQNGSFALVTADSTGHGVPGAIMSMLNIACLNEAVDSQKLVEPKDILNYARASIIRHLSNDGSAEGGKDGMDCSLLVFEKNSLKYAGANNPVWIVRNGALLELEPDRMPVGKHDKDKNSFSQLVFDFLPGDTIYALSDGFPDQFGGPKGKKFMYKRLKELLTALASEPLASQKEKLEQALRSWKGDTEQVDDVTIIGIRV